MTENLATSSAPFSVRCFEARDRAALQALGLVDATPAPPSPEAKEALANSAEDATDGKVHVWVAEAVDQVIGAVAVIHDNASLAHLKYLCVAPGLAGWRDVASELAETAIKDAYDRGYLKLVVHTPLPPSRLTTHLHYLGFEFSRERLLGEEHALEFYLNLYQRPPAWLSDDQALMAVRIDGDKP